MGLSRGITAIMVRWVTVDSCHNACPHRFVVSLCRSLFRVGVSLLWAVGGMLSVLRRRRLLRKKKRAAWQVPSVLWLLHAATDADAVPSMRRGGERRGGG